MLVHGKYLFPLNLIEHSGQGYYISSGGTIYSTRARKNQLTELRGSTTPTSGRYYQLAGTFHRESDLRHRAQSHDRWLIETSDPDPAFSKHSDFNPYPASIKLSDIDFKPKPVVADRAYAQSLPAGIKQHGIIIAAVGPTNKLVFGTEPKIHITQDSYRLEMQRLAALKPGTKFVALQIVASVVAGGMEWE